MGHCRPGAESRAIRVAADRSGVSDLAKPHRMRASQAGPAKSVSLGNGWLTKQCRANPSGGRIPCFMGNLQGISRFFAKWALANDRYRLHFNALSANSLDNGKGNLQGRNREFKSA